MGSWKRRWSLLGKDRKDLGKQRREGKAGPAEEVGALGCGCRDVGASSGEGDGAPVQRWISHGVQGALQGPLVRERGPWPLRKRTGDMVLVRPFAKTGSHFQVLSGHKSSEEGLPGGRPSQPISGLLTSGFL